jgi:hypothetical protein
MAHGTYLELKGFIRGVTLAKSEAASFWPVAP